MSTETEWACRALGCGANEFAPPCTREACPRRPEAMKPRRERLSADPLEDAVMRFAHDMHRDRADEIQGADLNYAIALVAGGLARMASALERIAVACESNVPPTPEDEELPGERPI